MKKIHLSHKDNPWFTESPDRTEWLDKLKALPEAERNKLLYGTWAPDERNEEIQKNPKAG